jgi:hypothetical protein
VPLSDRSSLADTKRLSDLNPPAAYLDLDVQLTADGLNVAAERIDLGALDVAVFEARNSVLANIESLGEFDLRQP